MRYSTCGEEIPFLTGFGATETAPATLARVWPAHNVANMGLPPPGAEMKLVPLEDSFEMRRQGAACHARLLAPARAHARRHSTRKATIDSGMRSPSKTDEPRNGLLFAGRIAEDFKLSTGTCVHVGPLRARFIEHFAPLVRDVVIAGEGRE